MNADSIYSKNFLSHFTPVQPDSPEAGAVQESSQGVSTVCLDQLLGRGRFHEVVS